MSTSYGSWSKLYASWFSTPCSAFAPLLSKTPSHHCRRLNVIFSCIRMLAYMTCVSTSRRKWQSATNKRIPFVSCFALFVHLYFLLRSHIRRIIIAQYGLVSHHSCRSRVAFIPAWHAFIIVHALAFLSCCSFSLAHCSAQPFIFACFCPYHFHAWLFVVCVCVCWPLSSLLLLLLFSLNCYCMYVWQTNARLC